MADSLQLKNHAFCFCLAVGFRSSKDHTNTGFALSAALRSRHSGEANKGRHSGLSGVEGQNLRSCSCSSEGAWGFTGCGKLPILPFGGSRGLQPPEVGQWIHGALAQGLCSPHQSPSESPRTTFAPSRCNQSRSGVLSLSG